MTYNVFGETLNLAQLNPTQLDKVSAFKTFPFDIVGRHFGD